MTTSPLQFTAAKGRVRALFEGHEIADSANALLLREDGHDPVYYFPREDVEMLVLRQTTHSSHCPRKGDASYFTIYRDRQVVENAAWSYETPIAGAELLAGRIAFYPQHVEIEAEEAGAPAAETGARDRDGPLRVPPHDPPYAETSDPRDV